MVAMSTQRKPKVFAGLRLTLPDKPTKRIFQTKPKNKGPFLKPPPFRIHLDMSDHAGRQRQAQTAVTAAQLTWDFCGQRHRTRQNMMCTDIVQCSCRIEHQWRSGGRWMAAAKYDISQKCT